MGKNKQRKNSHNKNFDNGAKDATHFENGVKDAEASKKDEEESKSIVEEPKQRSREGSAGSQEGIQLSAIKIITRHDDEEEEEEEEEESGSEAEEEIKPKKTVKKKKKGNKEEIKEPAEVLTHVLAKAIRQINTQKEKERQKLRQAEIRKMALEQKRKQELAGPPKVTIHMSNASVF